MKTKHDSTVKVKTNVKIWVYSGDKLIDYQEVHNAWQDAGLNVIRDWLSGDFSEDHITHIAWCEAGGTERARDIVTQYVTTTPKTLLIRQYLPSNSTANGYTIQKIRAYNAATSGTLFAEANFTAGISKTSSIQITAEWTHTFADDGV
ncbi:MAG: hypothetical protein PHD63_07210 [Candidatus Marinimicrobia bacterium]|nr:hypothetical protein [Candidatus Neomarinimicrobiota bacterium]